MTTPLRSLNSSMTKVFAVVGSIGLPTFTFISLSSLVVAAASYDDEFGHSIRGPDCWFGDTLADPLRSTHEKTCLDRYAHLAERIRPRFDLYRRQESRRHSARLPFLVMHFGVDARLLFPQRSERPRP